MWHGCDWLRAWINDYIASFTRDANIIHPCYNCGLSSMLRHGWIITFTGWYWYNYISMPEIHLWMVRPHRNKLNGFAFIESIAMQHLPFFSLFCSQVRWGHSHRHQQEKKYKIILACRAQVLRCTLRDHPIAMWSNRQNIPGIRRSDYYKIYTKGNYFPKMSPFNVNRLYVSRCKIGRNKGNRWQTTVALYGRTTWLTAISSELTAGRHISMGQCKGSGTQVYQRWTNSSFSLMHWNEITQPLYCLVYFSNCTPR